MRFLRFALGLLVVLLVHLAGVRLWSEFPRFVDLFLVLLVWNALDGDSLGGMLGGLVAGLAQDAVTGSPYGLHGIAGTLIGYLVARGAQQLQIQNLLVVGLCFVLAGAIQQAIVAGLMVLLAPDPLVPEPVTMMVKSGLGSVLGVLVIQLGRELQRARDQRRRHRVGRVRL